MDAKTKVSKYLADLKQDSARKSGNSTHVNTATLQTIRGPGQAAHDPLQFVSTSGVSLAENARQLINITEQQKRERAKLIQQGQHFNDNESWVDDLDTWRRKRKTKAAKQAAAEAAETASNPAKDYRPHPNIDYHSLPNYGRNHKETKEEILTITSPSHQEDQNDSGIENRTTDSHSPSTSLDFSPRSDSKLTAELISPKSAHTYLTETTSASRTEQPPDYAPPPPPPPPPSEQDQSLDQVVVPVQVSRVIPANLPQLVDDDDYPPPPLHLRRPTSSDRSVDDLSSRFESASLDIRAVPISHYEEQAATSKPYDETKPDSQTVDLTVELNREQRGQVTAVRYPATRRIETIPSSTDDVKIPTFVSRITHNVEPPPSSRQHTYTSQQASSQLRNRSMPPTTVYRAVDIPFDESPAAYQPKKDDNLHTVTVVMGTHPVQKGFGFTITIERGRPTIDSVVVGTPADRAGLLIGDRVISVNGEDLKDKYPSAINRMLHDAARLGEAEVVIERKDAKIAQVKSLTSSQNFDKARSVFSETRSVDSYAEFKRKHSRASRADQPSAREYNSLPRSTSTGAIPGPKRDNSLSSLRSKAGSPARSYYESSTTRSEFRSHTSSGTPDYRVTSLHEKTGPGKLTDFVPEVERNIGRSREDERREFPYRRASDEEPRLIRNYDLPPAHTTTTKVTSTVASAPMGTSRRVQDESVNAVLKRSTLPRNSHIEPEEHPSDDDTIAGKSFLESRDWRDVINQQRQAAPGRAADTQRIRDASASLGNLPAIINRKLEETRKFEKERQTTEYGYRTPHIDSYEREYGRFEKSYQPDYRSRTFDSSRYGGQTTTTRGVESDFATSDYRRREHREINPSTVYDRREMSYREDIRREPVNNDQVVAVSGKHRCAHCADELGRGAAMIIESLNLFYHLACFKCYVCKTPLGSGATGADVRVREGRLHCQSCYSNDRVQLSKV
ncbi:hypothetical protein RB195_008922 [Necator americanus]|uniref:LIM domain protein n=1 Tax=Necator americanus TaxID=51031 RepID=A0ABR1CQZ3_NECAM